MQTSMIEVRITEKKSSLNEIVKRVFDFIMNNEEACFCKKLSGSAKTYSMILYVDDISLTERSCIFA